MNGRSNTTKQIQESDQLIDLVSHTSERVDDLAASLYPPSHKPEVKENITPLVEHLRTILSTIRWIYNRNNTQMDKQYNTMQSTCSFKYLVTTFHLSYFIVNYVCSAQHITLLQLFIWFLGHQRPECSLAWFKNIMELCIVTVTIVKKTRRLLSL